MASLRYFDAGYFRTGLLSQLPKGMATIMLSVHDSPAGGTGVERRRARFFSPRCSRMMVDRRGGAYGGGRRTAI